VPVHCSASGKLFLAGMTPAQRSDYWAMRHWRRFTPKTLTDPDALEEEIKQVKRQGFALDNEEFLPGLMCVAVLVPSTSGRSNLCVAVQAPIMRLTPDKALGPAARAATRCRCAQPDRARRIRHPRRRRPWLSTSRRSH
jgi:DNA-binding IclR family transcriptional regulator